MMKFHKIYLNLTLNNTIISLTDFMGNVLFCSSAGTNGLKGARKKTAFGMQMTIVMFLNKIQFLKIKYIQIFIKRSDQPIEHLLMIFKSYNYVVVKVQEITPIALNGCRLPKIRKI
jgi:small subunit ribosomal protein S11